ncbi:MAG: putative entry exclusion protein TrbK-alt [Rhizomicrobium sp.]
MRARFVNWGCVGPATIYLGVAIGLVAGAITLERRAHHTWAPPPENRLSAMPDDALTRDLIRCNSLGSKAENDQSCIAAWAENRRRFFGDHPDKAPKP